MNRNSVSIRIVPATCLAILLGACKQAPAVVKASRHPPTIVIPGPALAIDLDQIRAQWDGYPMAGGHTRTRHTTQSAVMTTATIVAYQGVSDVNPAKPPTGPILVARMTNEGAGIEKKYHLKTKTEAGYYVVVDNDGTLDGSGRPRSRWRILEVPSTQHGQVTPVQENGKDLFGYLYHCPGHKPKSVELADFWNCSDGDIDHPPSASKPAASKMGFLSLPRWLLTAFGIQSGDARPLTGDEIAWLSCVDGCCTL